MHAQPPPGTDDPEAAGSRDPAVLEPLALCAVLAAATPVFLSVRETLAFVRPGLAFAIQVDYVAIGSGAVAGALGALALALCRGTRPEGRAKIVLAGLLAIAGAVVSLGKGLGLV